MRSPCSMLERLGCELTSLRLTSSDVAIPTQDPMHMGVQEAAGIPHGPEENPFCKHVGISQTNVTITALKYPLARIEMKNISSNCFETGMIIYLC